MSESPVADQISERYVLRRELGRGGMGVVYLAEDLKLDRVVAIKLIRSDQAADLEEMGRRLQAEARSVARLSHPGIVTLYDFEEDHSQKFIVMEYVAGTTLDVVAKNPFLNPQRVFAILKSIAEALDYAHRMNIIHRDIKPSNIIVSEDGAAKVMDFGIAKMELEERTLTPFGMAIGTLHYMSPEQLGASQPVTSAADRWSLAVTAYEVLFGKRPFTGADSDQCVKAIRAGLDDGVDPTIPSKTAEVFRRALSRSPGQRFPTCAAFVEALAKSYEVERTSAAPAPTQKITSWMRTSSTVSRTTTVRSSFS